MSDEYTGPDRHSGVITIEQNGSTSGGEDKTVLNIDDTLDRLMIPRPVLKTLLGDFRAKYADTSDRIGAMLDEGNREDAEREAHSLKGVAGSLGIEVVHKEAESLEAAIKDGDDDSSRTILASLSGDIAAANAIIDAFLAEAD